MEITRDLARAAALLRAGGIVAYPTETFYGLGALVSARPALARLGSAKLRSAGKPLPLVAADRAMLDAVVERFEAAADVLAARFWPGPLTLVLPARPGLPPEIAPAGAVGVRVPGAAVARELCRLAGGPVTTTSANLSGGAPVTRAADLDPALLAAIDGVLDGGECPGGAPSTVVAIERGAARLIREGAVPWMAIRAALGPQGPLAAGEGLI